MNGDLFSSISNLVTSILHDFANASGPANLITISGPVITIGGAIWGYLRYRLKDKDSQIRQLQEDRASRDRTIDKLSISQKELEARCAQAESELPQRALDKSEAEWRENNDVHSARAITEWFKDYGQPVSQMLLRRAQWAVGHAAGDFHSMGLVAAQSYAIAAVAVNQENHGAVILFEQAEKLLDEAEQPAPPLIQALAEFDERCHEWFDPDLVKAAMVAQNEAILRLERGYYHLAMPTAEQAQIWLIQSLGRKASATLRVQYLKALILMHLGRYDEALEKAESVVKNQQENPAIGPNHPNTLASRYLKALILMDLGRYDEALEKAESVLKDQEENPALGPNHPKTLVSRYLVALILMDLGRYDEALEKAESVLKDQEENPALGPNHPDTLVSRYLVAHILMHLGRYEEALEKAESVLKDHEENPALGPKHPYTLSSRWLVAQILMYLGRYEEALEKAESVFKDREENPAIGPNHPDTLSSRWLLANILKCLGRYEEALERAEKVANDREQNPAIGPNHPKTLLSHQLVANILMKLRRYKEALQKAESVLKDREQNQSIGPNHPDTLASRDLVTEILNHMGRKE